MSSDPKRIQALIEEAHGWRLDRPRMSEADTNPLNTSSPKVVKEKFNKDDIIRYGAGPSAIMKISSAVIVGDSIRYYGEQYFGGAIGAYQEQCAAATEEEKVAWSKRWECRYCRQATAAAGADYCPSCRADRRMGLDRRVIGTLNAPDACKLAAYASENQPREASATKKIITRDAVISAARVWAEADHEEGFTRGDSESTMRQINQKSDEVDKARKSFEKILDAWQSQMLDKA